MQSAGLNTKFAADGHYTVFAPNNDVFSGLASGTVDYFRSAEVRSFYASHFFVQKRLYIVDFTQFLSIFRSHKDHEDR